jgi:hypothetical protein
MKGRIVLGFARDDRHEEAFLERVRLRARELFADLGLEPGDQPDIECAAGAADITIDVTGTPVVAPLGPGKRFPAQSPLVAAEAKAERVAAALIRHRWLVIAPLLTREGQEPRAVLRRLSRLGLDLESLRDLERRFPEDDTDLEFAAADRFPRKLELRLHRRDEARALGEGAAHEAAVKGAATALGIPFPRLEIEQDAALNKRCVRLKVGSLRGPVEPMPWEDEPLERYLQRPLARAAPVLFDIGALLTLLLDPDSVRPETARAALKLVTVPELADACRNILSDGFGLTDPYTLCRAILAPPVDMGPTVPSDGELRPMPFFQGAPVFEATPDMPQARPLEQRLRSVLVPADLRRRAESARQAPRSDLGGIHCYWPSAATLDAMAGPQVAAATVQTLASAINDGLSRRDILVVPGRMRYLVRRHLRDLLPNLAVVAAHEIPSDVIIQGGEIG